MTLSSRRIRIVNRQDSRSGLVAIKEMLIMSLILGSVIWLGSQWTTALDEAPARSKSLNKAISERCVYCVSVSPSDNGLWVHRPREGVTRLHLSNGTVQQQLPFVSPELMSAAFSRDGLTALLCNNDGTVIRQRAGEDVRVLRTRDRNDSIMAECVSHDGAVSVCITSLGHVHGWGREESEFSWKIPPTPVITRISLGTEGYRLCVIRSDSTVSFHDSETGHLVEKTLSFGERSVAAACSDDERRVAIITSDGRIVVREVPSMQLISHGELNPPQVLYRKLVVEFSPDSRYLAVAMPVTTQIDIWDANNGQSKGQLVGHDGPVGTLSFSPASDRLYSGSYDGTIREWSMESLSQLRRLD